MATAHDPILVTGGRGYVGRWAVRRLVEMGIPVVTFDRDPWPDEPGVTAIHGELVDLAQLTRVLDEHGVDAVIHTAAISSPDMSFAMPTATLAANVMGTANVLEAARGAGIRRVVNFSSSSIYGWQTGPVGEGSIPAPKATYGVSKLAAENLATVFRSIHDLDVLSLRVCWVYGPGLRVPGEHVGQMIWAALKGEAYRLEAGAAHPLPLVFVGDVAQAAILAAQAKSVSQPVYNVAGPRTLTLGQAAEVVRSRIPEAEIEIGPGFLPLERLGDHRVADVDISSAGRDFNYFPVLDPVDGIDGYIASLREQLGMTP